MICTTMPGPQQEKIRLQPGRAIDVSAVRARASQGIFHPLRSICEALLSEALQPEAYWRLPQETILDCVYATTQCCGCSAVARESPGVSSGCVRMFVPPSQGVKLDSRGIFRACGLRCRALAPVDCWRSVSNSLGSETLTPGNGTRGSRCSCPCGSLIVRGLARRSKSMAIR